MHLIHFPPFLTREIKFVTLCSGTIHRFTSGAMIIVRKYGYEHLSNPSSLAIFSSWPKRYVIDLGITSLRTGNSSHRFPGKPGSVAPRRPL